MTRQSELPLDDTPAWERRVREGSRAYQAFCIYRDMGPTRTMREAYRRWADQNCEQPRLLELARQDTADVGYPGAWKRWVKQWEWAPRAAAYDARREAERRARDDARMEEVRRERQEQRLSLDRTQYDQIIHSNIEIGRLLKMPLGRLREERVTGTGSTTKEFDAVKALVALRQVCMELEQQYFACLTGNDREPGDQEQPAGVALGAEFTWVPNPQMEEQIEAAREVAEKLAAAMGSPPPPKPETDG